MLFDFLVRAVLLIAFTRTVAATPTRTPATRYPPSLRLPTVVSGNNFTAHGPQVFCQVNGHVLSDQEIKQCETAIAFLPIASSNTKIFGPYEFDPISRTPIISRYGRCEAIVDLRYKNRQERSSWAEVKLEGFRDIYRKCLAGKRQAGFARVGYYYGLELLVRYDFQEARR